MNTFWIIALVIFVPSFWLFSFAVFRSAGKADRELERFREINYVMMVTTNNQLEGNDARTSTAEDTRPVRYNHVSATS